MILALRAVLAGVTVVSLVALRELWLLPGGVAQTGLRIAAFVCVVALALLVAVLSLAPSQWLQYFVLKLRLADEWLTGRCTDEWRVEGQWLAGLGLLTLLVIVISETPRQRALDSNDQSAYLTLAEQVRDAGGPLTLLGQLFRGQWREANRHPLYPMLLSIAPTFEQGKWLSAGLGILSYGCVTWLAARRFGWLVAGVAGCLLSVNMAYCRAATLVTCEGLLTLLTCLTWLGLLSARSSSELSKTAAPPKATYWPYIAAGLAVGLAQMTKGTGLILLAGVLLWLLWMAWQTTFTRRHALVAGTLVIVSFLVAASPLIVRNIQRFGSPFYNDNSYLLFADQFVPPETLAARGTVSDAAREYFRTHSAADIARREVTGLVWEGFIFVRSLGPVPLDDSRIIFGLPIAVLALLGLRTWRCPSETRLLWCWTVPLVVLFAWYIPIVAGERFLLPILYPWLLYAAVGLISIWQRGTEGLSVTWSHYGLVVCGALWCAVWCGLSWFIGLPG